MASLKIKPIKFYLKRLLVSSADEVELKKKLALEVSVLKVDRNTISIVLNLKLRLEEENFGMTVTYAVDFHVSDAEDANFVVSDETLDSQFMKVNAPAIAYPYLRAFVSTVCINAGFKPSILPAVNFQAMYNMQKQARENSGDSVGDQENGPIKIE
ncbi:MAG TPA: protein-export chaperone SecB [Noviherbaspirillum sp.]|uniref:protein-export chaperone SecB n=1 Tax=Noviherbaspirillum sp. TaxID=1926288 RepID=UPI002DDD9995|nr:protein-export chaperone SecB [Noviherbaspirillum sp.]HEV2610623.1 protein-export chaperone SecB [Noviherbaspirillum sp.]